MVFNFHVLILLLYSKYFNLNCKNKNKMHIAKIKCTLFNKM